MVRFYHVKAFRFPLLRFLPRHWACKEQKSSELNAGLRSAQSLPSLTNNPDEHSKISA
jgi:hypothetical protein